MAALSKLGRDSQSLEFFNDGPRGPLLFSLDPASLIEDRWYLFFHKAQSGAVDAVAISMIDQLKKYSSEPHSLEYSGLQNTSVCWISFPLETVYQQALIDAILQCKCRLRNKFHLWGEGGKNGTQPIVYEFPEDPNIFWLEPSN